MRIDHLAFVTDDLKEARQRLILLEPARMEPIREVEEQYPEEDALHRYRALALEFDYFDPEIWLMEPIGSAGPLARFLEKNGPGIHFHHLGLRLGERADRDIYDVVKVLQVRGLSFIREPHRFAQDDEIRALLNPKGLGGLLIELVEKIVPR